MKSVNVRELLAAAVDGELTPAERKAARRVLRESDAARVLFAQLKADATRLKKLPRVPVPADLTDNVLAVINDRAMTPTPLPPAGRRGSRFNWGWLPIWANMAAAAGVMVAISLGSYLYFAASQQQADSQNAAVAHLPAVPPDHDLARVPADRGPEPREKLGEPRPAPEAVVRNLPPTPEIGPSPRVVFGQDTLTSPPQDVPEIEPFQPDKIRLSHLIKLHDLAGDAGARKKLTAEMKKDELIRLDLFSAAPAKALDYVLAALKARGIATVTDGFAQDRVRRNASTELMVFTEAMKADEVAQLMDALGVEDKKGAGLFDTLVAAPFLGDDLVVLGKLLGVPNVTSKLPKAKAGVDIRKPLPEGTADHVAASLSGMGGSSPTPPKAERMAVVVAYSPANANPGASREIKQFVDRRGPRKPDAKPVMLVLKIIPK
jgi:hypothetical protein